LLFSNTFVLINLNLDRQAFFPWRCKSILFPDMWHQDLICTHKWHTSEAAAEGIHEDMEYIERIRSCWTPEPMHRIKTIIISKAGLYINMNKILSMQKRDRYTRVVKTWRDSSTEIDRPPRDTLHAWVDLHPYLAASTHIKATTLFS
jgi:hypothetical protein